VRFAAGVNICEFAPEGRHSTVTGFTDFLAQPEGAHQAD
jgi:hypothetical protein